MLYLVSCFAVEMIPNRLVPQFLFSPFFHLMLSDTLVQGIIAEDNVPLPHARIKFR
jgi:hypothetical protein